MRLNKYIAAHTHYSRRAADELITEGRVEVNDKKAAAGEIVSDLDSITIDGKTIETKSSAPLIIMLNKPRGYVCSRRGQGSKTVYELLPENMQHLNTIGRLDKDSTGLLLLTNDGELANKLTHPRYQKSKVYEVELDKPFQLQHQQLISNEGVTLEDGISKFSVEKLNDSNTHLQVTLREGRNRQIRRTFSALSYEVIRLHRQSVGEYTLGRLETGEIRSAT